MPEWLLAVIQPLAGGSTVLGVLWLAGKWMDRKKPEHEILGDVNEDLRETVEHLSKQLHSYEDDLSKLRTDITKASIRLHRLTIAVHHCVIEYPETTRWWASELAKVEA